MPRIGRGYANLTTDIPGGPVISPTNAVGLVPLARVLHSGKLCPAFSSYPWSSARNRVLIESRNPQFRRQNTGSECTLLEGDCRLCTVWNAADGGSTIGRPQFGSLTTNEYRGCYPPYQIFRRFFHGTSTALEALVSSRDRSRHKEEKRSV